MIQHYLSKVVSGTSLTREESVELMSAMMEGRFTSSQAAALLTALRMKGETPEEISGLAEAMRKKATRVFLPEVDAVDTCGTGGDGGRTFNISTAAAIVAAAAGTPVAKHGNRAVSSKSGSADVLEALGVEIQLTPEEARETLTEIGICFLFAPLFHQAMKHVMATRKELGFRTCFNLLGPLANPAQVKRQLIGVYEPGLTETTAKALAALGTQRALVVSGLEGIDEISIAAETQVSEVNNGEVRTYRISPEELGLTRARPEDLAGGNAAENAAIIRDILHGKPGPKLDVVLANAGAVIYVAGQADTLQEGVHIARQTVMAGSAAVKLEQMKNRGRQREEVHHVS
jgi:anthranilate phosphoribosyltransferase